MATPLTTRQFQMARLTASNEALVAKPAKSFRPRPEVLATAASTAEFVAAPQARTDFRRFENTGIYVPLGDRTPPPPGMGRDEIDGPIADTENPTDAMLFSFKSGAVAYLPRYRLKQLSASRYDISIGEAAEGDFRIAMGFTRVPPPGVEVPTGAAELPHQVEVVLVYTAEGGLTKRLALTEITLDEANLPAGAAGRLTLVERDSLLMALQKESGVRINVMRAVTIYAKLPQQTHREPTTYVPERYYIPDGALRSTELQVMANNPTNRVARLNPAFNAVMATDATTFIVATAAGEAQRYDKFDLKWGCDAEPAPLTLDPALHTYFYAGVTMPRAGGGVLRRITIRHVNEAGAEQFLPYFQDAEDPSLFYYLPDGFRLGRDATEPFLPEMVVRMSSPDGTPSGAVATMDYVARPYVDPDRLRAAAAQLKDQRGAGGQQPARLEPLPAKTTLKLRVPAANGVEMRAFDEVNVDLASGFRHSLTVPVDQFRQLFAAAFSTDATSLFSGEAVVTTALPNPEIVPVDIRFNKTEGPIFDAVQTPGPNGGLAIRLRNGIESPVRIRRLEVVLAGESGETDGVLSGLDLTQPKELAPGDSIEFQVTPAGALPEGRQVHAIFDLEGVEILADPKKVLPAISDSSVPAEYLRPIEVMTVPDLLDAPDPGGPIILINVEFRNGNPVKITKAEPNAVAILKLPLINLLLGQDDDAGVEFRQQVVRSSGAQTRDQTWRRQDFGILVVPVSA